MTDKINHQLAIFFICSIIFYIGSLAERQFTNLTIQGGQKPTFKRLIIGYLIFIACSIWLYILIVANSHIISGN